MNKTKGAFHITCCSTNVKIGDSKAVLNIRTIKSMLIAYNVEKYPYLKHGVYHHNYNYRRRKDLGQKANWMPIM